MRWFMYWSGKKPWPAVQLSIDSVRRHVPEVEVFDDGTACGIGASKCVLRPELNHPQRADLLRLFLLATYGGVWLDSDIIMRERPPVEDLLEKYPQASLIAPSNGRPARFPNPFLVGRACANTTDIYDKAQGLSHRRNLRYTALGPAFLGKLFNNGTWGLAKVPRKPWLYKVEANRQDWYRKPRGAHPTFAPCYMAHTCGHTQRHFKKLSAENIMGSTTLYGEFMREAFGVK